MHQLFTHTYVSFFDKMREGVAQAADAFLSKIFACSYSIAGINVLHGNPGRLLLVKFCSIFGSIILMDPCTVGFWNARPRSYASDARCYTLDSYFSYEQADHLVHRHTHRVVRGTLLVCGRPDGRLTALTSLEGATCLSVSKAQRLYFLLHSLCLLSFKNAPFTLVTCFTTG